MRDIVIYLIGLISIAVSNIGIAKGYLNASESLAILLIGIFVLLCYSKYTR